ncbi:MAG: hypothetical protein E6K72_03520, partial [Candidatus Eisenbacteria bacterium]
IGVLGLCYRFTPTVTLAANVAHLKFADDSTTAARLVPALRKRESPDVVLVVGHIPAETDSTRRANSGDLLRLARAIPGVDAWFGGHSHNRVLDTIGGVPVMIPGSHGQIVAVCDLVVDPVAHRVVERSARLVTTYADEVEPDSAMAARVARWNANVAPLAALPVGRNARLLGRGGPESAIGDRSAGGRGHEGCRLRGHALREHDLHARADSGRGAPRARRRPALRTGHASERHPLRVRQQPPARRPRRLRHAGRRQAAR